MFLNYCWDLSVCRWFDEEYFSFNCFWWFFCQICCQVFVWHFFRVFHHLYSWWTVYYKIICKFIHTINEKKKVDHSRAQYYVKVTRVWGKTRVWCWFSHLSQYAEPAWIGMILSNAEMFLTQPLNQTWSII